jgi:hypothetical protein
MRKCTPMISFLSNIPQVQFLSRKCTYCTEFTFMANRCVDFLPQFSVCLEHILACKDYIGERVHWVGCSECYVGHWGVDVPDREPSTPLTWVHLLDAPVQFFLRFIFIQLEDERAYSSMFLFELFAFFSLTRKFLLFLRHVMFFFFFCGSGSGCLATVFCKVSDFSEPIEPFWKSNRTHRL